MTCICRGWVSTCLPLNEEVYGSLIIAYTYTYTMAFVNTISGVWDLPNMVMVDVLGTTARHY